MTTATWVSQDTLLGSSFPGAAADAVVTSTSGTTNYGPLVKPGTVRRFEDSTGVYGAGTFIYLPGVASLAVGDVVTYTISAGVASATDATVTRWAGTANSGAAVAVAMTANTSATTFSWYMVQGAAVVNTNGTVAAGDRAFWQATATVSSTAVAGKQVLGMTAASANGVPSANKAVYLIDWPCVQSQIT